MDPIAIGQVVSSIGAPLIGYLLSKGKNAEADRLNEEALAQMLGISLPELREMKPHLLEATALADVTTDPRFEVAQDEAMSRLQEIGRSGGMDARARGRMEEARLAAGTQAKGDRDAVLAGARARGTAGTGEELSAMLQADQSAADRERMAGIAALSDAEQRSLEASVGAGNMGAQRQARQWDQRAQVADAKDRIDEFNAQVSNDFTMANDANRWRQFEGELNLAGAQNDARYRMADRKDAQAERLRKMIGGVGQGATYGLAGYQQAGMAGGAQPQATGPAPAARPQAQQQVVQPQQTLEQQRTRRKVDY
jgi:hypothetical protein